LRLHNFNEVVVEDVSIERDDVVRLNDDKTKMLAESKKEVSKKLDKILVDGSICWVEGADEVYHAVNVLKDRIGITHEEIKNVFKEHTPDMIITKALNLEEIEYNPLVRGIKHRFKIGEELCSAQLGLRWNNIIGNLTQNGVSSINVNLLKKTSGISFNKIKSNGEMKRVLRNLRKIFHIESKVKRVNGEMKRVHHIVSDKPLMNIVKR
jgi:hypothetical protein